ncbi:cucumisin-like [Dorcoceras hygrometricum]|uniref:Cucumisin-like n=1 Tax=Dorcoceras hygrometricum TaxID=472368 RepID=A0A2Z7CFJ2_9LAMI|nr:cucumisin-like [Dorcoceras hygrometricum]
MVKRLATSPHDPLGITDSACKNQLVVVSVQYGPFNTYIPIRSTTIGKSRVARDPITMHTSWRSNSDIASVTREKRQRFAKLARRRLDVATGTSCEDLFACVCRMVVQLRADVNAGQLSCSLRLVVVTVACVWLFCAITSDWMT